MSKVRSELNSGTNGYIDHHLRLNLHEWPKVKSPGPYEIFAIAGKDKNLPQDDFNKMVKGVYQKYIKIYHPDINKNLVIKDNKGNELTMDEKRQRYDLVRKAYEILTNPQRRKAFNAYSTTSWDQTTSDGRVYSDINRHNRHTFHSFRTANAHRYQGFEKNEKFWTAGNWQDYYRMNYNREPPTKEEIERNSIRTLLIVVAVGFLAFLLQVLWAVEKTNESIRQREIINLAAMQNLNDSYDYSRDPSEFQRLNRFLTDRRATLVNDKMIEEDEELVENDYRMLTDYARKKVSKFDRESGIEYIDYDT